MIAGIRRKHLSDDILTLLVHPGSLALYAAREYYTQVREFPTGKGCADVVYFPRKKYADKPAMIIELKWDKDVARAVDPIRETLYCRTEGISGRSVDCRNQLR